MKRDIPLDPMHFLHLGIMKKLLFTRVIRDASHVRLCKRQVDDIDAKILALKDSMPIEFARKPRTLKFLPR